MFRFNTALFVLCALLGLSGCHEKKKPSAQLPPAPAPTASSEPPPFQQPTPQTTQEPPSVQQPTQQQTAQNETSRPKPQPRHPRHTVTAASKKPATTTANEKPPVQDRQTQEVARNVPPKIVIQEGSAGSPGTTQAASGNMPDDTAHNETTGQLLDSTEANLRNIKRQLSSDEQTTQAQIKDYVSQARQAIKDGDMVRAHNLAVKAHLLSDELVKQR
ncbi:MAG: hypothetical protein DMG65_06465 [Candidatus Angelobacter sp. Gp1-AA117]|nr:MAG: hypothetical protein DMG65_06465 [Candidatus Angelobacter sp. Gp1-AA117]